MSSQQLKVQGSHTVHYCDERDTHSYYDVIHSYSNTAVDAHFQFFSFHYIKALTMQKWRFSYDVHKAVYRLKQLLCIDSS